MGNRTGKPLPAKRLEPVRDSTRRRDGLGLLQVLFTGRAWRLNHDDVAALLCVDPKVLERWGRIAESTRMLDADARTRNRISEVLGVHAALVTLLPSPANRVHWLRKANTSPDFKGRSPLELMLMTPDGLSLVRRYLAAVTT